MIELTDEQINSIINRVRYLDNSSVYETDSARKGICLEIQNIVNELTIDQIKQLAEQHNASVVQWVEFDSEDASTWPGEEKLLLAPDPHGNLGQCTRIYECDSDWLKFHWCGSARNLPYQKPFKWAYLPQPKEK